MAECMFKLLSKKGTIIIEVQYLLNTLKDLHLIIFIMNTIIIGHLSLVNFFKQFDVKIFRSEKVIPMVAL